jgi:2-dehydropantoate 2-reductase
VKTVRIIVAGAGAIGSAIGGYLADEGFPVVLIARPVHVEAIRARGLVLQTPRGGLRPVVSAVSAPAEVSFGPGDILFLACKSQDTRALLAQLDAPRDTPVFCFQNGVRNEEWAAARFARVYGAVPWFSVNFLGPGSVEHTVRNGLVLGAYPSGLDSLAEELAGAFRAAGFEVPLHPRVMSHKWGKLIVNLNNALYPLVDTWQQWAYSDPEICNFMAETMREGLAVLTAAGIEALIWPGDQPVQNFIDETASGALAPFYPNARELPPEKRSYPSTWQDVRLGRPTSEVDYFNGEIVELARKVGVSTPYNTTLVDLMRVLLSKKASPGLFTLAEVVARVREASRAPS